MTSMDDPKNSLRRVTRYADGVRAASFNSEREDEIDPEDAMDRVLNPSE